MIRAKNAKDRLAEPKEVDGMLWIIDNKVYVKNELKNGLPPMINPCEGVKLFINDIECKYMTSVSEQDEIKIELSNSEKSAKLDVIVSDDKMIAYIDYYPQCVIKRTVQDHEPANRVDIVVEENISQKIGIKRDAIENALKMAEIVYGFKEDVMQEIIESNNPGKYLIAEGKVAIEATDETVECFFKDDDEKELILEEDETGRIDFKNAFFYKDTKIGDTIAKIHPMQAGIEGMTVIGEVIVTKEPKKVIVVPNASIFIDENNWNVIAKKAGRPTKIIKKNTVMFNIIDRLVVDDVNLKSGNIRYNGDVEVKGTISEAMEVVSKQNVFVRNNVCFAQIMAGNNVEIKGSMLSSKVYAATGGIFGQDPAPEIYKILVEVEGLIKNLQDITQNEIEQFGLDSMFEKIRYLMNTKSKNMTNIVYGVIRTLKKGNYDIETDRLLTLVKVTRVLLGNYHTIEDIASLEGITGTLRLMSASSDVKITGNATFGYVLNSEIHALGNVAILGKGASNSKVDAKGNVTVTGNFRGGEIKSEKSVDVNITGAKLGVKTFITVPEDGVINIRTAYVDTLIKIGNKTHRFFDECKNIKARIKNGVITF